MRLDLLALLACPDCGGEVRFATLERFPGRDHEVRSGTLGCAACGREFPIRDGVPRMGPKGWRPTRGPARRAADAGVFLEETMIPREEFAGKVALDAGCGAGWSAAPLALGAQVVALDSGDAIARAAEGARGNPGLHAVEGDPARPPFRKGAFDLVFSRGALSHGKDARGAFRAVAAVVKPRGLLSVWVHGRAGLLARLADALRGARPRSRHAPEELMRWFEDAGFTVLKLLEPGPAPKVGALGRRTR